MPALAWHMLLWTFATLIVPLLPIVIGWIASGLTGAQDTFREYAVDIIQDGQLCFYSVALACAQVLEVRQWHRGYTPYRNTLTFLCIAFVGGSLVLYGIIAALKHVRQHMPAYTPNQERIAKVSLVVAALGAMLVAMAHLWVREHGG
jgi:hypothetical protein